uniref:ATP synthase complex subunit 8 n=1 Tax=Pseudocarcinus gigas TaxID=205354 RepID=Q5F0G2_PSEGG|nr:ATP synthase F0 subunit 8 [Pseudocarcinus gigas]AAT52153.1 ATP synthase F0 subunit 8 [Pseudocarcinus gigas]
MPQMAPLMWIYLFFFFLLSLMFFLVLNYYIKPFQSISTSTSYTTTIQKLWKL